MSMSLKSLPARAMLAAAALSLALTGCPGPDKGKGGGGKAQPGKSGGGKTDGAAPQFKLAWSEYPSWSVFGVASELGIINGKAGEMGELEKKHNVDVVLNLTDYDTCMTVYGASQTDAVCLTNMDILALSLGRPSVAIMPTSTSKGADACIVSKDIKSVKDLKGKKVYGLEKSVSEYTFVRNLELLGEKEGDYSFTMQQPDAAAQAMQQKKESHQAIVVWNPFVLSVLESRDDVHVLFDSSKIPGEIVDMVFMGADSLKKPGGDRFAKCIAEAFYAVSKRIEDAKTRKDTLVALGEKFSNLSAEKMETVVKQTVFYKTPDAGAAHVKSDEFKKTMERVVEFCVSHEMVKKKPKLVYGTEGEAAVRFDPSFMEAVK